MADRPTLSPDRIRAARAEDPKARDRDLAHSLGLSEAQLVAAHLGHGATRLEPGIDGLFQHFPMMGEVMALTRNDSCVIERVGRYENAHIGRHAGMVLAPEIDLRMFPSHWVSAFAVERETDTGIRRSVQVFDAAGDAVHKVFLRDGSDMSGWRALMSALTHADQSPHHPCGPRKQPEPPRADPARAEALRADWSEMTDTHQFLRMVSRLKMNRLGAYRLAGAPLARPLALTAVAEILGAVTESGLEIMVFVGNQGCIEIHSGGIGGLHPMGPWLNVLDPRFNLHLRADHIAEVWAVSKPTQRGPAVSVEAFDARGALILQIFGRSTASRDCRPQFDALVRALSPLRLAESA